MVVVVDDLQWVDRPSVETLIFAARRLRDERVAVVLASRPPDALDSDEDDVGTLLRSVPRSPLSGLSPGAGAASASGRGRAGGRCSRRAQRGQPAGDAGGGIPPRARGAVRHAPDATEPAGHGCGRNLPAPVGRSHPAAREGCRVMALAGRAPGDLVVEALAKLSAVGLRPARGRGGGAGAPHRRRCPVAPSACPQCRGGGQRRPGPADPRRAGRVLVRRCRAAAPSGRGTAPSRCRGRTSRQRKPSPTWPASARSGKRRSRPPTPGSVPPHSARTQCYVGSGWAWPPVPPSAVALPPGRPHLYDLALDDGPDPAAPEARAVLLHERGRVEHGLGRPVRAYDLLMSAARSSHGRQAALAAAEAVHAAMYARRPDLAQAAAAAAGAAHDPAHPMRALSRPARRGRGGRVGGRPAGGSPAHGRSDRLFFSSSGCSRTSRTCCSGQSTPTSSSTRCHRPCIRPSWQP